MTKKTISANKKNVRVTIPDRTRYELWVSAAGRCEFSGCGKPLLRDFLTKEHANYAEVAHIIADSPEGPRGDLQLSKGLAKDQSNLLLKCPECHKRIDRNPQDYPAPLLREMKRKHENRVAMWYSLDTTKQSTPLLLAFPIGSQAPTLDVKSARIALLKNSIYELVPSDDVIYLDDSTLELRDHQSDYWRHVETQLPLKLDAQLGRLRTNGSLSTHISVFAFGPMPVLILLGRILGDKGAMSVYQWSRQSKSWLWDKPDGASMLRPRCSPVPQGQSTVAFALSLSAPVNKAALQAAVPDLPVVEFTVETPDHALIACTEDIHVIRTALRKAISDLRDAGTTRIELFPAAPLSVCVELGRMLLPKSDPEIRVWDYQHKGTFIETITIR